MPQKPKAEWEDQGDCLRLLAPEHHVFVSNPELHEYVYDLSEYTRREARADAKRRGVEVEPCRMAENYGRCDYCYYPDPAQT